MLIKGELLAPAGDFECLDAALYFGADAVYIGGEFMQLRAKAAAFSLADIEKAATLCREKGKKLYVTVNSFANNQEIAKLFDYGKALNDAGVDAAIVSDIGALDALKKGCPDLEIHISTQANCMNYGSANVYYNMGAKRIVLARELTLSDIAEIRANTNKQLELETFVHGAMCMAYSGRCLISSYLTGRSGNRGDCAQSCRWSYGLVEQKRPDEMFTVEESENGMAILSSEDLNCLSFLDKIANAGVVSFKIEGRMKSRFYVASTVNAYRKRMDGVGEVDDLQKELSSLSHRPYSNGFYLGERGKYVENVNGYIRDCTVAALVTEDMQDGKVTVMQRNYFKKGDRLEVVSPNSIGESFVCDLIINKNGDVCDKANKATETVTLSCDIPLKKGDFLRTRQTEYDKDRAVW